MANLSSITGSLGVSSPQEAFRMVSTELTGPFKEVMANLSPSAIISSLSRETGLDEIAPTITSVMGDIKLDSKERKEELKDQVEHTKKINTNLTDSKDILLSIDESIKDIYKLLSKEETAADISERRTIREQGTSGVPSIPLQDTKRSMGFLGNLANFFGDARNLIGTGLIASATAGLSAVVGLMRFFGRLALRGGAFASIFAALASLDRSDWEETFKSVSSSIEKWKDGEYLESIIEFTQSITGLIKTALDNIIEEFSTFISSFGLDSNVSGVLSTTAIGASLGILFGPGGALVGAILGFVYSSGKLLSDWLERSGMETERDLLASLGRGAGIGASIGLMFGPKGVIIGAIVGGLSSLLVNLYNWVKDQDWNQILTEFKNSVSIWWNDTIDYFKSALTNPIPFFKDLFENSIFFAFHRWLWNRTFSPAIDYLADKFNDVSNIFKGLFENSIFFAFPRWIWNSTFGTVSNLVNELFSGNVRDQVIDLINQKAPWMMNLGKWVYDTFIDPIVEIFRTIRDAAGNIREYALSFVPDWAKKFFGVDDEAELERMRIEEEAKVRREQANALQQIKRQAEAEKARAAIRSMPDQSMFLDVNPSGGTWSPRPGAVRSRDITPETNNNRQQDPSTIVGNITVDQSINNSRSGSDSYGPLSTRPKNSRLEDYVRGGIGTMDFYGF